MTCPAPLGVGVKTRLAFCEVMAERDPSCWLAGLFCVRKAISKPRLPARNRAFGEAIYGFFRGGFGAGPGRYSSVTLLTTAIGRPGCE